VNWYASVDKALKVARTQDSPVMLDFWASWCTGCLDLDAETFSDPVVQQELKRFISVKVDCTNSSQEENLVKLMEKYEAMDLPTIRFIDSKGRLLKQPKLKGFEGPTRMLKILKQIN